MGDGLTVCESYVLFICTIIDVSQDPLNQYPGYLTYAAFNPYHPLVNQSVIDQATANWSAPDTGCQARVKETITISSHNKNYNSADHCMQQWRD